MLNDEIKFSELNPHIKKSKKNFVFLIKNAEKLAEMKKQTIFYNLLEWMKSDIKDYIGIVFTTKNVLMI